jgi:hypothetical protein
MLQLPQFLKRIKPAPPEGCAIYVQGNLYMRQGSDLVCLSPGGDTSQVCGPDHIAPNGVAVQQIAYAIALIEGMVTIGAVASTGVGMN